MTEEGNKGTHFDFNSYLIWLHNLYSSLDAIEDEDERESHKQWFIRETKRWIMETESGLNITPVE